MYNEPPPEQEEPKVSKFLPKTENYTPIKNLNNWFKTLSQPVQVVVMTGGVIVGFTILNIFLKIVASLLTIAVLATILYVVYRFVWKSRLDGD
jgi:hypothetical protein